MTNNLTDLENVVLTSLRSNVEGGKTKDEDGRVWQDVYLDNAMPTSVSAKQFSGVLGSLEKKGYYTSNDDPDFEGVFGSVRLN